MGTSTRSCSVMIIVLSIMLCISMCDAFPWWPFNRTKVYIYNYIGKNASLLVHCRSVDDDLDEHWLSPDPTQGCMIKFYPMAFGNTLFFCGFTWPGQFKWFDIYKTKAIGL
ncbi:S-protein homolog 29-like [Tripterygium wilfordii]|uniref:S-protein homolog 29-like n=1 Tax=Tripterygium wilfordii TaxID=458696 RepID=UPI0018F835BB|nr:S-protein homolog 29-like [Tripterygium wilfordii]